MLEAAFESAILFDVFAVLIEGGGANALYFAAGQGRLQDVGRVNGAFRAAGADEGMEFVNEQDGILGPANFVHDRLDAFFELSAVFGAGHHHRQIQDDDAFIA